MTAIKNITTTQPYLTLLPDHEVVFAPSNLFLAQHLLPLFQLIYPQSIQHGKEKFIYSIRLNLMKVISEVIPQNFLMHLPMKIGLLCN